MPALLLCCLAHTTLPVAALPVDATAADVAGEYEAVNERFQEMREAFGPLATRLMQTRLPSMMQQLTEQVNEFVADLQWAPALSSVGRLVDRMAWGPSSTDARSGDQMSPSQCGDSDSCRQVIAAVKDISGVFKGPEMFRSPFFNTHSDDVPQA